MQLDQITANIRLRSPWEAMDLGFALVRNSWQLIYLPWFLFLSFMSVLSYLLVPADYKEFALFAVWWLKPLYDRFLLNIISHQLFNEHLSTGDALRAVPGLIRNTGLASGLTFRRPSFSRGFNLPIWQLEQLRGKRRSARQNVLLTSAHSHAIGLTLGMIFIELSIYLSFYALIVLFAPETFQKTIIGLFFSEDLGEEVQFWLHILDHVIYTIAVFLIEPFYVAASFTLYLNRRTQLEAWDIELVFRQLAKRLQDQGKKLFSLMVLPAFAISIALMSPTHVYAEETSTAFNKQEEYLSVDRLRPEKSKEVITEIVKRPELSNEKKTQQWVKIKKKKEGEKDEKESSLWKLAELFEPIVKIMSVLFESSLWILLLIGLLVAFVTRNSWLHLFKYSKVETSDYEAPEVMFGMDIRPESLPDNIPDVARRLWQEHKHRDALSLLYRGALAQLVNHDEIPLRSSQTEGDILKTSKKRLEPARQKYLKSLTEQWKLIAYAHRIPEESSVGQLFDNWDNEFIGEKR